MILLTSLLKVCCFLLLPLLIVPHVLGRWFLPGGRARVVVHIIDTTTVVLTTLPAVIKVLNEKYVILFFLKLFFHEGQDWTGSTMWLILSPFTVGRENSRRKSM